ncbi:hypothetical protein [Pedobacter jamesrossensis]|uniref:Uncharacterized protein n=1 Tax=Pedobacter jamesrossensis TaxID=1908238 RepID=A0ABV8NPV9_9SPHI
MSEKVKLPSGIVSCQYSVDGINKGTVKNGENILLKTGQTHRFYLDPEKGNLGDGTKDKTATSNQGKWAYILSYLWSKAKDMKGKEVFPSWGRIGNAENTSFVEYCGIGQQYKLGSYIEFTPGDNDFWLGNSYRMEVFNNIPNKGFNFNFFPVNKPDIRFAYFDEQKFETDVTALGINDGLYHYGQTIDIHIFTHLLPAKLEDKYNVATERNFEDLVLEIILTDMGGSPLLPDPVIKGSLSKYYVQENGTSANAEFNVPFFIDPNWKGKIHFKGDLEKDYSVIIKIKNTKTNAEYKHQLNTEKVLNINPTTKDVEETKVSRYILVKYETAATILKNFEISKNNQIQFIGDVQYQRKEFDPCGYSKISVTEDDGKRKPFDLFDEDAAVIDRTTLYYDVIRGDKRKGLKIDLVNLKNKGVMCTGVLLEKGQHHSDIHNVFQMKNVVLPFKNEQNKYIVEEDNTHKKQLKAAGIPITEENKKDYDYKADPSQRSKNVAVVQNLKENIDYQYAGDSLKFLPHYIYNKTVGEDIMGYDISNFALDKLWPLRYLFLGESNAQTYFIPVGSCRYPNQLARIRVFPDVKWKVSFLFSDKKTPQSFASTGMPSDGQRTTGDNTPYHPVEKRKSIYEENVQKAKDATAKRKAGGKTYDFDLTVSCNINGESHEFAKSIAKKIDQFASVFVKVKQTVDTLCHNDEKHALNTMKKIPKPKGMPLYIKFDYPSIKIDGSWEYAIQPDPTPNTVESSGKITMGFEPLIKGEGGIDLIALALLLAKGVPVVSQVLWALELLEDGVELVANWGGYAVSKKLEFNVYAFSQIDARVEIPFNTKDYVSLQVDGRLGIGAQLKMEAGIVKKGVNFEADNNDVQGGYGLGVDAKGESFLELLGSAGIEKGNKGFFIEPKINFGGVKLTIIVKTLGKPKKKNEKERLNKPIWIVEKKSDIIELRRFHPFTD